MEFLGNFLFFFIIGFCLGKFAHFMIDTFRNKKS